MYSVVLMMALTSGGDVPAGLFNHGCCGGCYGGGHGCRGGCHGCSGGCYGGCYGYGCCGGGHKHRHHGCCGGCYGGGCCGGGFGCCGGGYGCCGGGGCFGCAGGGCFGCAGGVGGVGAPVVPGNVVPGNVVPGNVVPGNVVPGNVVPGNVVPGNVAPGTGTPPPAEKKKSSLENAAPATLIVTLPADARLSIDGETTTSSSTERVFVSPALNAGRDYHYTLEAEFLKDGKMVKVRKDVAITAGKETRVNFDADTSAKVASR